MNTFNNAREYPPADFKSVVRPNSTPSIQFLSRLTKEPMIFLADTNGRYYLLPMLDMWTDVFASPGWRTTGTQAGTFSSLRRDGGPICATASSTSSGCPGTFSGSTRRRLTSGSSAAPRPTARADYDAVHKIQAGFKVTPLSEWGRTPRPPVVKIDPTIDMKTPPKTQVDTMPAANTSPTRPSCQVQPPHITDQPIIAQMKRIGIEPGKSFDIDKVPLP